MFIKLVSCDSAKNSNLHYHLQLSTKPRNHFSSSHNFIKKFYVDAVSVKNIADVDAIVSVDVVNIVNVVNVVLVGGALI